MPASQRLLRGFAERQDALMDAVFGAARDIPRPISAASNPAHPASPHLPTQRVRDGFRRPPTDAKAMPIQRFDQIGDGCGAMQRQVQSEHIAKLSSAQT